MKSSKKILGASAALGLAIALSAGSTFAWFTAGRTNVDVGSFDLNVTDTADGMDMKVGFIGYAAGTLGDTSYSLDIADNDWGADLDTLKLKALTLGATDYDTNDLELYDAEGTQAEEDDGYYTFRLAFMSTKPGYVYLDNAASVTPVATKPAGYNAVNVAEATIGSALFTAVGSNSYGANGDGYTSSGSAGSRQLSLEARAANAARVLFQAHQDEDPIHVWSPNEYYYTGKPCTDDTDTNGASGKQAGFYKGNLADVYNKIIAAGTKIDTLAELGTIAAQKEYSDCVIPYTEANKENATKLAILKSVSDVNGAMGGENYVSGDNYFAIIDVTIWIEGTDGDCFDAILSDALSVALKFKGVYDADLEA